MFWIGLLFFVLAGSFIALIGYFFWLLWRGRSGSYLTTDGRRKRLTIIDTHECPECGDKKPDTTEIFVQNGTWYWLYHCQVCDKKWYFADKTIAGIK